jgi:C1A family cysteine protease
MFNSLISIAMIIMGIYTQHTYTRVVRALSMKAILLVTLLVLFVATVYAHFDVVKEWERFKTVYNKRYSRAEESRRFEIFKENLKRAEELRAADPYAEYGVTQFMDLSPQEFRARYLMSNFNATAVNPKKYLDIPKVDPSTFDTRFDWRDKGMVTRVYNQGSCGSCWAFSVTENIESMWAIAGNPLTSLSMQELVDCDSYDGGCNGGYPDRAFRWVIENGGLDAYSTYPYTGYQEGCAAPNDPVARISSFDFITTNDNENAMMNFVTNSGPPSVCVDAELWQFYKGGIVTGNCGTSLDHCVQLVGYDTMNGVPVWIVRNSWGTGWGVGGYIYLKRGANVCGIGSYVTSAKI